MFDAGAQGGARNHRLWRAVGRAPAARSSARPAGVRGRGRGGGGGGGGGGGRECWGAAADGGADGGDSRVRASRLPRGLKIADPAHGALPHRGTVLPLGALRSPCTACGYRSGPRSCWRRRSDFAMPRSSRLPSSLHWCTSASRGRRGCTHTVHSPRRAPSLGALLLVVDSVKTLWAVRGTGGFSTRGGCSSTTRTRATLEARTTGPHMMHSHTVHLPLGAQLIWCTMCGTGAYWPIASKFLLVLLFIAQLTLTGVHSIKTNVCRQDHTQCTAHAVHLTTGALVILCTRAWRRSPPPSSAPPR